MPKSSSQPRKLRRQADHPEDDAYKIQSHHPYGNSPRNVPHSASPDIFRNTFQSDPRSPNKADRNTNKADRNTPKNTFQNVPEGGMLEGAIAEGALRGLPPYPSQHGVLQNHPRVQIDVQHAPDYVPPKGETVYPDLLHTETLSSSLLTPYNLPTSSNNAYLDSSPEVLSPAEKSIGSSRAGSISRALDSSTGSTYSNISDPLEHAIDMPVHSLYQEATEKDIPPLYMNDNHSMNDVHSMNDNHFMNDSHSMERSQDSGQDLAGSQVWASEVERKYLELVPMFNCVNADNFADLLAEVIRQCPPETTLSNFYKLLYSRLFREQVAEHIESTRDLDEKTPENIGLIFCLRVLETFRAPNSSAQSYSGGFVQITHLIQNAHLEAVNTHELQRTFLALKVISMCAESANDEVFNIARLSLYKVHYIIIQRLILDNTNSISTFKIQQNVILSQSRMGKILKLAFPNAVSKRLGSRGSSKYHYLGMKWKKEVFDDEISDLIRLDVPEIKKHFEREFRTKMKNFKNVSSSESRAAKERKDAEFKAQTQSQKTLSQISRPLHSFVGKTSTYPSFDCSPRSWEFTPNAIPKQTEWSKNAVAKSLQALRDSGVDFDFFVTGFSANFVSERAESFFFNTVSEAMDLCINNSLSETAYLHMCLIVLLMASPVFLASDREIPHEVKKRSRTAVGSALSRIEMRFPSLPAFQGTDVIHFTWILKRLFYISELTSSKVTTAKVSAILNNMVGDIQTFAKTDDTTSDQANLATLYVRGLVTSLHAFGHDIKCLVDPEKEQSPIEAIQNMAQTLLKKGEIIRHNMMQIPGLMSEQDLQNPTYDLSCEILRISASGFHEVELADDSIRRLPISVLSYLAHHSTNEVQDRSFHASANWAPDSTKETFKTWWVFSTMFKEYMTVLSEISALSMQLA